MAANPPAENPWGVPALLRWAYDWCKAIGLIGGGAGFLASLFIGYEKGAVAGTVVGIFFAVLYAFYVVFTRMGRFSEQAEDVLSTSKYTQDDERKKIVDGLRLWRTRTVWSQVGISAAALLGLAAFAYHPVTHWWTKASPAKVQFEEFHYLNLGSQSRLAEDAPFMEAVVTSLAAEGEAEGKKYRVAVGKTVPFRTPTHPLRCKLMIAGEAYNATGYAFRRTPRDHRGLYEAVRAEYPDRHSVVFSVPACEPGDWVLVVVLLTANEGVAFPEDLREQSHLVLQ